MEGALAVLALFLFVRQGVLPEPSHWLERVGLAYWLVATAVLLRTALPPAGLGYWLGTVVIAAALLGASGGGDRRRTLVTLGVAVALCGMVRFAVIPFMWRHATLPDLGPLEFSGVSDWAKGLITDHEPVRAGSEILNVLGLALYAAAIWRSWPRREADPLAGLAPEERERLLAWLVLSRLPGEAAASPPALASGETHGQTEPRRT